jgi:hypothetical protein
MSQIIIQEGTINAIKNRNKERKLHRIQFYWSRWMENSRNSFVLSGIQEEKRRTFEGERNDFILTVEDNNKFESRIFY